MRNFLLTIVALAFVQTVSAYTYRTNSTGQPLVWPAGTISLQLLLDNSTVLGDGTTRATAVQAASETWNTEITNVQFTTSLPGAGAGTAHNGVNEVFFSATTYGATWGSSTLAITVSWFNDSTSRSTESDVLFNPAFNWNSYRGNLQGGLVDIRRVALHELGHVLGLDHPDQHGQSVIAIMNSAVSDIDSLQVDDILGAQGLYGSAGLGPVIISQPQDAATNYGASVTLTASATGSPSPSRTWQVLVGGSGTWQNLTNTYPYSGVFTDTLSIAFVNYFFDSYKYRCVYANPGGVTATNAATLSVHTAPIVSGPNNQTAYVGDSVTFSVGAAGSFPFTYQWQKGTTDIVGQTGSTLTLNSVQLSDNGSTYRVIVTNAYGSVTTPLATLTVSPVYTNGIAYSATTFPDSVAPGTSVAFNCNVTNSGTKDWGSNHYLVLKDSAHVSLGQFSMGIAAAGGTSSPSLNFTAPGLAGTYTYYVQAWQYGAGYFGPEIPLTLTVSVANAIGYVSNTFPASAIAGSTVNFLCNVTNLGPQAWGANHYLVLRSPTMVTLTPTLLNGVAPGGSLSVGYSFTAPGSPGTYTYHLQAFVAGTGYFGTDLQLVLTVVANGQPPPMLPSWQSLGYVNIGQYQQWSVGIPSSGAPFTFQWYKDGTPIAGANSNVYSKPGQMVREDAGNYSVTITNAAGVIASPDLPVVWFAPTAPWLDVKRLGDVVYFLYAVPGMIARYDLAQEAWLPQISLGTSPTAFLPTAEGVFIAYDKVLVRRSLDLGSEAPVANSATRIDCLLGFGNVVYFLSGPNAVSYDRATLTAGPSFVPGSGSFNSQWWASWDTAFATNPNRGYFTFGPTSTPSIRQFTIESDGTFDADVGDYRSPGALDTSGHLYLSPDQHLLFDRSGVVYDTTGPLPVYARSLGLSFDDLAFLTDGTSVVLRGNTLSNLAAGNYVESGRVTLTGQNLRVFGRATNTFVFGDPGVAQQNPTVVKIAVSAFAPAPTGTAFNPSGTHFSTDDMFIDPAGVIHVMSRSARGLIRWSVPARNFLPTIPMHGGPAVFSYSSTLNQLVAGYQDGSVSRTNLNSFTPENCFGYVTVTNNLMGLVAMDDLVSVVVRGAHTSGDRRLVLNANGLSLDDNNIGGPYNPLPLAWQPVTRMLYSQQQFGSSIVVGENVPLSGIMPGWDSGTGGLTAPLRPNADGTRLMAGNGVILNSTLGSLATLTNAVSDGAWLPDGLYTIRAQGTGTQVQKWSADTSSGQLASLTLPGIPLRIFRFNDTTVVAVTSIYGYIAFHTITSGLSLVDSSVNDAPRAPPTEPAFSDYNSDGKSDLVWQNTVTGDRSIWLMNGPAFLGGASIGTIAPDWKIAGTTDFNGDGKSDLLWENTVTGDHSIWLMNGTSFLAGGYLGQIPTAWKVASSADFNGDGKADLLWENTVTGDHSMWLMDGVSFLAGGYLGQISTDWSVVCTGDLNGDGKADIIWQNKVTGEHSVWLMNGTSFFAGGNLGTLPTDWKIVAVADFNGDGKGDLVWENTTTGEHAIWLMSGATFLSGAAVGPGDPHWLFESTGDYNGDGKADLVWKNTVTGERAIWLMNGTAFVSGASLGVIGTDWSIAK